MLHELAVFLSTFLAARAKLAGSEQSWREGLKQEEQFPIMLLNGFLGVASHKLTFEHINPDRSKEKHPVVRVRLSR